MSMQDYINYYLMQQQEQNNNTYGDIRDKNIRLNDYGTKLSKIGSAIQDNVSNKALNTAGSKIQQAGNALTNATDKIGNVLNAPETYFKGFANRAITTGLNSAGNALANKGMTTAGNAITNAAPKIASALTGTTGATAAGTTAGAATGAGTAAATGAGTAAGTAAGATTGAAAGGAGAGAAGGAAAGGAGAAAAGGLAALAVMALLGSHRNAAKKQSRAMMEMTNKTAEQGNEIADSELAQTQQFANDMQQMSNNTNTISEQGNVTGGAAPMPNNRILEYQEYLRNNGYSDDVVNGVAQGLNSGDKDIAQWISQYNKSADGKANPIIVPTNTQQIQAAKQGKLNNQPITGQTNYNQTLIDKLANGLADLSKGYSENRNTAFKPENLQSDPNKNKMTRTGEFFGTIGRLAQRPSVQGLIAGGLSTALTGNPLYGAGMMYKFANARQTSDILQQALKDQGINVSPNTYGNIDTTLFSTLMTPKYKDAINQYNMLKLKELQAYHEAMNNWRQEKNKIDKEYKQQKLIIDKQNAESNRIRANKTGSKGSSGSKKLRDNPQYRQDLAELYSIYNSGDIGKIQYAEQAFIKRYGEKPKI